MRTMWCLAVVGVVLWLNATGAAAMTPGPTMVLQCPDSAAVVFRSTLRSGNTLGGIRWSDGEASYPMLPTSPELTRCSEAGRFFWVEDAHVLGKVGFMGDKPYPETWNTATEIRFLTEEEYLDALAAGAASTPERELRLRIMAWRAGNDCSRGHPGALAPIASKTVAPCRTPTFPAGSRARQNLETLARTFHPKDDNERILQAEMLRELGRFAEASELLSVPFPQSYAPVIRSIQDRVRLRDDQVFVIP